MRNSIRITCYVGATLAAASITAIPQASADTQQPWSTTIPTEAPNATNQAAPLVTLPPVTAEPGQAWHVTVPKAVHTVQQDASQVASKGTSGHSHAAPSTRPARKRTARPVAGRAARAHVVREGETLSELFPRSWRRIAAQNGISNPDLIFPGQVINV